MPDGRVLIAFDDGPLVVDPTWTRLDSPSGNDFPEHFVAGYDIKVGRQTLISQTDTGTATVFINDHKLALFDPRNTSSPYYGKLDGKQILLQLYNPVTDTWESQFRGHIDEVGWEIDPATDADGVPINASIQIACVDIFDFLGGFGLTPGLDGVRPPKGSEAAIYYGETLGSVDDRIIEILMDVTNDSDWVANRAVVFSGNVHVQETKYDADESALAALRDACDAEFPFIANMYADRFGRFCFHGRYSRFDPDFVSSEAGNADGSRWGFQRWKVGDGVAVHADATRAQMRVLSYVRSRPSLINAAIAYPQGIKPEDMPGQVYADTASMDDYGRHSAPPMGDLITKAGIYTWVPLPPTTANEETAKYAELLVKNQKDPREAISALQIKTVRPTDDRAERVWAILTESDISDIVNVKFAYPAGTGFTGASPADDYYIEGREMRVRPLADNSYDYVELDLQVSPAVWSMDTHGVFPAHDTPVLIASFIKILFGDDPAVSVNSTSSQGPSGPITAYDWDWGDSTTHGTSQNDTHVYAAPGVYDITLTVTGTAPDGTDTNVQTVRIT